MLGDPNVRDPNISGAGGVGITPATISLQPPTEDTYARQGSPASVYGTRTYISYNPHSTDQHWPYYKFDFSGIPGAATVTAAKLELYNYVLIAGSSQALNLEAHRITTAWAEASLNWNNKPAHDAASMGLVSMVSVWHLLWAEILLTDLTEVQQMIDDAHYGLMLKLSGTVGSHNYYRHYSSEYVTDPTLTPKLTITYE